MLNFNLEVRTWNIEHRIGGKEMAEEMKIKLPKEIELKVKADKELQHIIKKRIESDISREIKEDMFLSLLFDSLLSESELTKEDVSEIDHKVKKGIAERLGWK